jgi:hypothetical protein
MAATPANKSRQSRHHWTLEQIRALGATTDLVTACSIFYKVGKSQAWERFHRGQLNFPAFKNGRSVIVPVAPLLRLLAGADVEKDAA